MSRHKRNLYKFPVTKFLIRVKPKHMHTLVEIYGSLLLSCTMGIGGSKRLASPNWHGQCFAQRVLRYRCCCWQSSSLEPGEGWRWSLAQQRHQRDVRSSPGALGTRHMSACSSAPDTRHMVSSAQLAERMSKKSNCKKNRAPFSFRGRKFGPPTAFHWRTILK